MVLLTYLINPFTNNKLVHSLATEVRLSIEVNEKIDKADIKCGLQTPAFLSVCNCMQLETPLVAMKRP